MYTVAVKTSFSAAHRLRDYNGKCESMHGHNWDVEVSISGKSLGDSGMLVDFSVVKEDVKRVIDELDHRFLNEINYFKDKNPTSESIAYYIYLEMKKKYKKVKKVTIWETNNNHASYEE